MCSVRRKRGIKPIAGIIGIFTAFLAAALNIYPIQAETGKGEDIFKVILTIFEADKSSEPRCSSCGQGPLCADDDRARRRPALVLG